MTPLALTTFIVAALFTTLLQLVDAGHYGHGGYEDVIDDYHGGGHNEGSHHGWHGHHGSVKRKIYHLGHGHISHVSYKKVPIVSTHFYKRPVVHYVTKKFKTVDHIVKPFTVHLPVIKPVHVSHGGNKDSTGGAIVVAGGHGGHGVLVSKGDGHGGHGGGQGLDVSLGGGSGHYENDDGGHGLNVVVDDGQSKNAFVGGSHDDHETYGGDVVASKGAIIVPSYHGGGGRGGEGVGSGHGVAVSFSGSHSGGGGSRGW